MAKKAATKKAAAKKKAPARKTAASKTSTRKATVSAGAKKASGKAASRSAQAKRGAVKSKAAAASKKAVSKKPASKKAASKKAAPKKTVGKAAAAKKAPKKAVKKKAAATKAPAKKGAPAKKVASKSPAASKKAKTGGRKAAPQKGTKEAATKAAAAKAAEAKTARKGITIVTKKKIMRRPPAPKGRPSIPAPTGSIMGMGLGQGRPLIPSSNAPAGSGGAEDGAGSKKPKSPFTKRQLEKYREILLRKRRELLGDIDSMENEALKSEGGASSNLPQHMADQGSDTYDQTLSLDLAAADRTLLREIDDALDRIASRTYGICEQTGKPINKERLDELPWARFSIEAAREMERRGR